MTTSSTRAPLALWRRISCFRARWRCISASTRKRSYPFESTSTANYRGHIATYEISDGRLYLVDLQKAVPYGEKPTDPPGKLVKELFPQALDDHGKVPVEWFTGNIRIFGKPEQRHYQSPGDAKGYDDTVFTTVSLLQIDKGAVKRETTFPFDEYWQKFETVAAYEALKPRRNPPFPNTPPFSPSTPRTGRKLARSNPKAPRNPRRTTPCFSPATSRLR